VLLAGTPTTAKLFTRRIVKDLPRGLTFNTIGVETQVYPVLSRRLKPPVIEAGANFPKVLKLSGSCGRYQSYGISKLLKFDFFQS
jgi:hypothetical protein